MEKVRIQKYPNWKKGYFDMNLLKPTRVRCNQLTKSSCRPCQNWVRVGECCHYHREKNLPATIWFIQKFKLGFVVQMFIKTYLRPRLKVVCPSYGIRLKFKAVISRLQPRNLILVPGYENFEREIYWMDRRYLQLYVDNHEELLSNFYAPHDLKRQLENEFNMKYKGFMKNYAEAYQLATQYCAMFPKNY